MSEAQVPWSFRSVYVYSDDIAYVTGGSDEQTEKGEEVSYFFRWQKGWSKQELPLVAFAAADAEFPDVQILVFGIEGNLFRWTKSGFLSEIIDESEAGPQHYGDLRSVKKIGKKIHVAGMSRTVYRCDGVGEWTRLDHEVRDDDGDTSAGFNSIDGFSEKEIYAVGWDGEIFWRDDARWSKVDSPTNLALLKVVCASNKKVFACGMAGTLLVGHRNAWEVVDQDETTENFVDAVWFKGALYLATATGIFRYYRETLKQVLSVEDIEGPEGASFNSLDASKSKLWSVGRKLIATTEDGKSWTRLPTP